MNPELPDLAVEFGSAAAKAFDDLGRVDCARRAETDPSRRDSEVHSALVGLGADELDPRTDLETAAAAAELSRIAGRCVLPYPLAGFLLRQPQPLALVSTLRIDHGDLFDAWRATTLEGSVKEATPAGRPLASKLGPFVTDLAPVSELPPSTVLERALLLTLSAWRVLGVCERAVELAVQHVRDRVQFGQPLAQFQAVQFQLADASVAVEGLRELCRFTLWRAFGSDDTLVDALSLRVHALDVARAVLRTTQQLHGAAGVCDEYDISILCRHVQPELRLPFGSDHTAALLFDAIATSGFESLFRQGGLAS
jgi:hypothetical protein